LYQQTLGRHLSYSTYVTSLYWAIVFGHAFLGIRQQHVCLLKGLCRVVSYSSWGVEMDPVWVYMQIRCFNGRGIRTSRGPSLYVGGGLGVFTYKRHFVDHSAVKVSFFCSCFSIHNRNSVMHFAIICVRALPQNFFGRCNVGNGTLKIAPFHRNHDIAAFTCRAWSLGGGKI
jgi:hypothetical protein